MIFSIKYFNIDNIFYNYKKLFSSILVKFSFVNAFKIALMTLLICFIEVANLFQFTHFKAIIKI